MSKIIKANIAHGIVWIDVPDIDLQILCGCPADSIKLISKKGMLVPIEKDGIVYQSGPEAILLSDIEVQNGEFSNLSEFPIMQMLYKQGLILPNHPNNTGRKPILIGSREQLGAQMEYLYRGNYGLVSREEMILSGLDNDLVTELINLKLKFAFGQIRNTKDLVSTIYIANKPVEIRDNFFIDRKDLNIFEMTYGQEKVIVDINLAPGENYAAPYFLGHYKVSREYFSIIHCGEGNGWDEQRPCMSSIITYQGKIYLIDAGPNIDHSLNALGIGIDEIEGIFHTHSHDDHFAGLTTLIKSDHKIKYFSNPIVRFSVAKKLSALLGTDEMFFHDYFDVHDLHFDQWNNINGLEVMPIFSPHPVETNIFYFRTLWDGGYKIYGHLADTIALQRLQAMVCLDPTLEKGISAAFFEEIKRSYLMPVDLKKIDIGGGLVHGDAEDFQSDKSKKIILSHSEFELSDRQKEIGSGAAFATHDVLIGTNQDMYRKMADRLLKTLLSEIPDYRLNTLLNNPVVSYNPETIIIKEGSIPDFVLLIVSGNIDKISSKSKIHVVLSSGTIIDDFSALLLSPVRATYRARGYVDALRIPASLFRETVKETGHYADLERFKDINDFLQSTSLFGDSISQNVQTKINKAIGIRKIERGYVFDQSESDNFFIIESGKMERFFGSMKIDSLLSGDFFNEENSLLDEPPITQVRASEDCYVYQMPVRILKDIPIIRWKVFEIYKKRKNRLLNIKLGPVPMLEWKQEYNVNMQKIDIQHKRIFQAGQVLYHAIVDSLSNKSDDNQVVLDALDHFIEFLKRHFNYEESLLMTYNHSQTRQHRQLHRSFIDKISDVTKRARSQKAKVRLELVEYIGRWLASHIKHDDIIYARELNKKGIF